MANRVTVNGIMRIFFSMVIKLSLQKEWYFPGISNIIRNARKIGVYFSSYSCFRLGLSLIHISEPTRPYSLETNLSIRVPVAQKFLL